MPRGKRNNYNYYYPQRSLAVGKRNKYSTMTYYIDNGVKIRDELPGCSQSYIPDAIIN